jgi:cyclase
MRRIRVIPTLLIDNLKLVKTQRFKSPSYVGDPINSLKIFNEKEVDEIAVLDIGASRQGRGPDFNFIRQLASECFMPLSYGGGITSVDQAKELFKLGVEKVVLGKGAFVNPELITSISNQGGAQSIVVSVDVRKDLFGRWRVFINNGTENTKLNPVDFAIKMESLGAGELLLQNIDLEGMLNSYDLSIIRAVAAAVKIPVVASGGAANVSDFLAAVNAGASAVAAGAMFVYKGTHRAVLINYPSQRELKDGFYSQL